MPRLTIAIPTVNRADLLDRAIKSALAQTSPDIEIIVSDNGSTDETPAVIERYVKQGLPNLRTLRHSATMPVARHSELILEQVRGELLLALSDDDFLEPEFAAEVLAAFDRHPESSFVYTGCAVHYENVQVPVPVGPPLESGADFLANHFAGKRQVQWCACVTRVRDLREIGPLPDDRILGDMYYWTRLAFKGPVGCVPRVLSHYIIFRPNSDNMSHGTPSIVWVREARLLADEVIQASCQAGASPAYLSNLKKDCTRHVALSAAHQIVWTRLRGVSWLDALKSCMECRSYLSWDFTAMSRLFAGLMLPRRVLRKVLLRAAARQADARRDKWRDSAGQP